MERNDQHLADAAIGGDVAAFEQLYRRHCGMVHSLARRWFGARDADDLTQDVFVRAWQKLATFRGEAPFRAWLRTLTVRLLANRWHQPQPEPGPGPEPTIVDAPAGLRLDLDAAIGRLPAGARAVFVLHDIEGLAHDEIAALLQVSVGTTKSQLHRARALLRARLGELDA